MRWKSPVDYVLSVRIAASGASRPARNVTPALTLVVALVVTLAVAAVVPVALPTAEQPALAAGTTTHRYEAVGPCRLVDQRIGLGVRSASGQRLVVDTDTSECPIPAEATALFAHVTVTGAARRGYTVGHATGTELPFVAQLNHAPGDTRGNAAVLPIGADGSITVFRSDGVESGDVVIDVVGVFIPASAATAGRFVAFDSAERLLDTRLGDAPRLAAGSTLTVGLPDGAPPDATAVAVTAVLVDNASRGHLTLSPAGLPRPLASALNTDRPGQVRSATTIVPVTADGFDVYTSASSHVVIDVAGWFTGPSAASSDDGLFIPAPQQRLVDTRPWPTPINPGGTIDVTIPRPDGHQVAATLTSMTMIRADQRSFLTAHATGVRRELVASGNTVGDEVVAQLSITSTSAAGISVFSRRRVDLTIDLFGWFTGPPAEPDGSPRPTNPVPIQRVLTIGDSAHAGIERNGAFGALRGAAFEVRGESCRRLVRPSCNLRGTGPPPTALDTLRTTPFGRFDVLVMQTGYNDQMPAYAGHVRQVLDEARRAGFRRIVWFAHSREFRSDRGGASAFQVYARHNAELRALAAAAPDVVLVEWGDIVRRRPDFLDPDGIHLRLGGGFALADAISRSVAHVTGQPCPMPETSGGPLPDPCPNPGTRPTIEPTSLYDLGERIVPCAKEGPLGETICRWSN